MLQTRNGNKLAASRTLIKNVAVIGAGPVGLAAAAHLIERGITPMVFEARSDVAANMASFDHVKLFSPWQYNLDAAAVRLLSSSGWQSPDAEALPTARQIIDEYLKPLSQLPKMVDAIHFNHQVIAVARQQADKVKTSGRETQPYVVRTQTPQGIEEYLVSAVIDASGTWQNPNPMGSNGLPALGEVAMQSRISYGMPDILGAQQSRFANQSVLVLGSGHSALGNLLNLVQLVEVYPDTRVTWAVRGDGSQDQLKRIFGGGDKDQLAARGKLGKSLQELLQAQRIRLVTGFRARAVLSQANGQITLDGYDASQIEDVDQIIVSTGARPQWDMHRELRLSLDTLLECSAELSTLIDPNQHSCGTVPPHGHKELAHPEANFYAIGAKSYGRAPNFLMATGYEQARSVVAALAQDWQAADDVKLNLPQTGVCETDFNPGGGACCGGQATEGVDAEAKAAGESGCGCDSVPADKSSGGVVRGQTSAKSCCG